MKRKAKTSRSYDQAALEEAMALLGVSANYSKAVLAAFRRKAKHAHPDAGGRNEMMRLLIEAKELLLAALASTAAPQNMPAHTPRERQSYEQKKDKPVAITPIEYGGLQEAYDWFNKWLFGETLPDCFITYQRKAHSAGYFSADRFAGRIGRFGKHELALNPDGFIGQTDAQICQTLVHEMVHAWQQHCGKPSARGYHNKEWAAKMKSVGLQPSATGAVGGKETGQRMSDYMIPGAAFEQAYQKLAATGWGLNLQSAHRPGPDARPNNSKTKFTCSNCGDNAWGKPDLKILCLNCNVRMKANEGAAASYDQVAA